MTLKLHQIQSMSLQTETNHKMLEIPLLGALLLSGFFGGIGFFTVISNNPTLQMMSDAAFAEYWQHLDSFMAVRMRIFGSLLLLSIVASLIVLYRHYSRSSFILMLGALLVILLDLFIGLAINHPLNQLIQSWDFQHLPVNVGEIKNKVVGTFYFRSICMIGSFILVGLAFWRRNLVIIS